MRERYKVAVTKKNIVCMTSPMGCTSVTILLYLTKDISKSKGRCKPPHNTIYTMRVKKQYIKVSREKARQIILNTESALTREMVERYTDSELKEWMKQLHFKTDF